jgi:hypothetical protein
VDSEKSLEKSYFYRAVPFLTDDILTELQGISLNDVTGLILEHFGIA